MKNCHIISSVIVFGLSAAILAGCATKSESKEKKSTGLTTNQLPAPMLQVFHEKFPAAGHVEWKLKSDKNYEAEFTLDKVEIAVKFDPAGKWLETERAIPQSAVPPAVQSAADKQFKGSTVVESQTLQTPNTTALAYELHLKNAKETVKAVFSADGALVSQTAKPTTDKAK